MSNELTSPPPIAIGIIGGGQLGMLIAVEAKKSGCRVAVLDPSADCPAGRIADRHIVASFSDPETYSDLGGICDVMTYELEHIDAAALTKLEAGGMRIVPSPRILAVINDKYAQKQFLSFAGIPVPPFYSLDEINVDVCLERIGLPMVFKYRRGGYDGKGIFVARTVEEVRSAWTFLSGKNAMVEQCIEYEREISVICAKNEDGEIAVYPPAENLHEDGILRMTWSPARVAGTVSGKATEVALSVLHALDSPGLFCVEMFVDRNQNIFVNEIAPRPHNSGHHTLDACETSQYEQLVRILCGMPLGSAAQRNPCVMANILGDEDIEGPCAIEGFNDIPAAANGHLYWYGKATSGKLRKMGHVTVVDESLETAEKKAKEIIGKIAIKPEQT